MTSPEGTFEDVRSIAGLCENLVEDTIKGKYTTEQFTQKIRHTGISAREAEHYFQELNQRLNAGTSEVQHADTNTASSSSATHHGIGSAVQEPELPSTPEGLSNEEQAAFLEPVGPTGLCRPPKSMRKSLGPYFAQNLSILVHRSRIVAPLVRYPSSLRPLCLQSPPPRLSLRQCLPLHHTL